MVETDIKVTPPSYVKGRGTETRTSTLNEIGYLIPSTLPHRQGSDPEFSGERKYSYDTFLVRTRSGTRVVLLLCALRLYEVVSGRI